MTDQHNFLLFFPDQWRGDCLEALGHPVVETPFLNELAADGTLFTSAYTPCPSCIPARACLATGMMQNSTGRLGYLDRVPWRYENTMMRCLRDGGYQTLNVGKTHFYPQRAALGFEEMRLYEARKVEPGFQSDYHRWLDQQTGGLVHDTIDVVGPNAWTAHPWVYPEQYHPNTWTADAAIELLSRRDPLRPFFLQVGFQRPHPPIDPPLHFYERFADRPLPPVPEGDWCAQYDHPMTRSDAWSGRLPGHILGRTRRAYYAQLAHLDVQIGRIMLWLKKNNLYDSTTIIFTSDHGEMLGDHHLWRKFSPWEGSARIPFIVRPAKTIAAQRGAVCDLPVSLYDIMPTFLQEANLPIPATVEGLSLSPLLRGADTGWRAFIHGEHVDHVFEMGAWQFLTDGHEKYCWETKSGREYFFDLEQDPQEEHNRAADAAAAERVTLWRTRLIAILAERPEDGLSDGARLIPGRVPPRIRPWLAINDPTQR